MSAETPKPQAGDMVRVILEGRYVNDDTGRCVELADKETYGIPDAATVEVLERADDPSKDRPGTVRDSVAKGQAWIKVRSNLWVLVGGEHETYNSDIGMREYPVVGVAPRTPAAEAQEVDASALADACEEYVRCYQGEAQLDEPLRKICAALAGADPYRSPRPSVRVPNEPHGIPLSIREQLAELLSSGNKRGAVGLLAAAMAIAESEAIAYVESMSEYQAYLAAHGGKREPRTFPADGPEPPYDVTVLRDDATDHDDRGYLLRAEDGWCWSHRPEAIRADCGPIQSWKDAASSADGNLWEVV